MTATVVLGCVLSRLVLSAQLRCPWTEPVPDAAVPMGNPACRRG